MRLLVDTQVILWWKQGSRSLGRRARIAIGQEASLVFVSTASAWEIALKSRAGRLSLSEPLHHWMPGELEREGFLMLNVTADHVNGLAALPDHHEDPFDRLLIAQARHEGLTIVTADPVFQAYGVSVVDARV